MMKGKTRALESPDGMVIASAFLVKIMTASEPGITYPQ